ncbi:hypothetical protein T265_09820 [Opisthorchis viverrini]|uniref:Endoplasmic Reticulum Oxidoreductin 1 n=1 Tax=Opisthorchis viverrini TaxID=6198 RepID=A0A074ZFH6_OPIVI|nr:hypothetical protein T265_09820 [Opisthorchis viverrini]KER21990.1 hypothetical protein T265_09820 [Opisthorchis viverrini]
MTRLDLGPSLLIVAVIVTLTEESCFPKVSHSVRSYVLPLKNQGHIGDVHADIEYVNHLNNYEILPRLQSIVNRDYFHYFEINLARGCPFFSEPAGCRTSDCHVSNCRVEEVPVGLRTEAMLHPSNAHHKYDKAYNTGESAAHDDVDCELGKLDSSLSEERRTILGNWTLQIGTTFATWTVRSSNPTSASRLPLSRLGQPGSIPALVFHSCGMAARYRKDPTSENMIWVDLLKNPEQFTGYKGVSSARIWHMIYAENCFNEDSSGPRTLGPSPVKSETAPSLLLGHQSEALRCLEKRVFYRMISGLHTSITVHLCAKSPRSVFSPTQPGQPLSTLATTTWGPKPEEFYRRFHPEVVPEGLDRLRSLYFAYLVELRALAKVAPYLRTLTFYTGNPEADADTQRAINDLLKVVEAKGNLFDERQLFAGQTEEAKTLKHQMREHFYNISRIMDCVGCDKCRLWGKLQTLGMGTALKILFSTPSETFFDPIAFNPDFQLSRREIVALFNAFSRKSPSDAFLNSEGGEVEENCDEHSQRRITALVRSFLTIIIMDHPVGILYRCDVSISVGERVSIRLVISH